VTAWKDWDTLLLNYQGDPLTKENYAVIDAFQHVERHGGDYNPFNVGPGPFHGINLSNPPYSGLPSGFGPTLDFPGPSQGIAASEVVGESNWSGLLTALKGGHPLGQSWIIDQGAATPPAQYTAEVRSLASAYLSGSQTYNTGDTTLNRGGGSAPGGGSGGGGSSGAPTCHASGFTVSGPPAAGGDFTGVACTWYPNPAQSTSTPSGGYPGTMNKDGTQCCVAAGTSQAPPLPGQPGTTVGQGCVCFSVPSSIPLIGGDLKTCILPQPACDFFGAITSTSFWLRAGEVLLGAMLLWLGLSRAIKSLPGPGDAAGAVGRGAVATTAFAR
jgi:hypothetical protein